MFTTINQIIRPRALAILCTGYYQHGSELTGKFHWTQASKFRPQESSITNCKIYIYIVVVIVVASGAGGSMFFMIFHRLSFKTSTKMNNKYC